MTENKKHKKRETFHTEYKIQRNDNDEKQITNVTIKPCKINEYNESVECVEGNTKNRFVADEIDLQKENLNWKINGVKKIKKSTVEPEIHFERRKQSSQNYKPKAIKKGTRMTTSEWDIRSLHSVDTDKFDSNDYTFDIRSIRSVEDLPPNQSVKFLSQSQSELESIRKVENYLKSQESNTSFIKRDHSNHTNKSSTPVNNLSLSIDHITMVKEEKISNPTKYRLTPTTSINQISIIDNERESVISNLNHLPPSHLSFIEIETGSKEADDLKLNVNHVKTIDDDIRSITSNSIIMEDEWIEYQPLPRQPSIIKIEKQRKLANSFNLKIDQIASVKDNESIKSGSIIMEDEWTEYFPLSRQSSIVDIQKKQNLTSSLKLNINRNSSFKDNVSIKSGSMVMEDEWTEFRTIPNERYPPVMEDDCRSIKSSSVIMEDEWTEYQKIPFFQSSVNTMIETVDNSESNNYREALDLVDHYSYRYENSTKTEKLKDLTNIAKRKLPTTSYSFGTKMQPFYDSVRKIQRPVLSTECLKQTFHVDHEDEELLHEPTIYDAQGEIISNLSETNNFKSITEYVTLQVYEYSALIKIEIAVEMFHNLKPVYDTWKRKNVTLTRMIELDLLKIKDSQKLKNIMNRCDISQSPITWTDGNGNVVKQYNCENRLTGKDVYLVLTTLLEITRKEEERNSSNPTMKDDFYLTSGPGGQLTSLAYDPQYLISGYQGNETPYLYY